MTAEWTRQRMKSKPWQVHVLRRAASVENPKDASKLADVLRSHSSRTTAIVERPQAPVFERLDHTSSLVRSLSPVERRPTFSRPVRCGMISSGERAPAVSARAEPTG